MSRFKYKRLRLIFDNIQAGVRSQTALAEITQVTTRTIRNDVQQLKSLLCEHGAELSYDRTSGYYITVLDSTQFGLLLSQDNNITRRPRTVKERGNELLTLLLLSPVPIKLEEIASNWYVSRSTLQSNMTEVRQRLANFNLSIESLSGQGMRIVGKEQSIRLFLTELWCEQIRNHTYAHFLKMRHHFLSSIDMYKLENELVDCFNLNEIDLSKSTMQYMLIYCAVTILRINQNFKIINLPKSDTSDKRVEETINSVLICLENFTHSKISDDEKFFLSLQLTAKASVDNTILDTLNIEAIQMVNEILEYVFCFYHYDLRADEKLKNDLNFHLKLMMFRLSNNIIQKNPLLLEIKQHYPFAYDLALSTYNHISTQLPNKLSEDEIGYLAIHLGVALERNYNEYYTRPAQVLLVNDLGNAITRIIENRILREFPHIEINRVLKTNELLELSHNSHLESSPTEKDILKPHSTISEDFIITTAEGVGYKHLDVIKVDPFLTEYQIETIGRLLLKKKTVLDIVGRFFHHDNFMILHEAIDKMTLFKTVCGRLKEAGYVGQDFLASLIERENILSTYFGNRIALPHSLGLLAKRSTVFTVLVPQGLVWHPNDKDKVHIIFLIAMSKAEYEEMMAIYNLFVTFIREKTTKRILTCKNFDDFMNIAQDCSTRQFK